MIVLVKLKLVLRTVAKIVTFKNKVENLTTISIDMKFQMGAYKKVTTYNVKYIGIVA